MLKNARLAERDIPYFPFDFFNSIGDVFKNLKKVEIWKSIFFLS